MVANQGTVDLSSATIVQAFQNAVERFPDNNALVYNQQSVTYKRLNTTVNQLAYYLMERGLQKGSIANIVLPRSIEAIISIFAVLKCGATYVPVDAGYPSERVNFMVNDSGAQFIITNSHNAARFKTDAKEIIIEAALTTTDTYPQHNPDTVINANDPMYIIYTSGSTGTPKGAVISYGNIMHFLKGMFDIIPVDENYRMSAVYSISFDPSGGDYYMALTKGATLFIADAETLKDGNRLHQFITGNKLTYFKSTPSLYKLLLDSGWSTKLPITFVSGGEPLPANLAKNLLDKCNALYNVYGPTECTIISTATQIFNPEEITIGRPLLDTFIYILNDKLEPVANGDIGELYISGNGVGLGYYKRPDVTEKSFLVNKFFSEQGNTMYKTGDLVRRNEQGQLIYIGRVDNQVKVRGYRIELEEIEHLISHYPGIKEVAVKAKANHVGENVLIAYLISNIKNDEGLVPKLRKSLEEKLPEFMVPSYFMVLNEWPLLPNGKINYNALAGLPTQRPQLMVMYKAPQNKYEKELVGVWGEVLGISGIGVQDNFFELGGNSLLAQRTVSLAKTKYGYEIPITKLYQFPTIAGLNSYITGVSKNRRHATLSDSIETATQLGNKDIAIIGLECNFPGAPTIEAFWDVLVNGKETITFFANEEMDPSIPEDVKNDPAYVKARGIIKEVDKFDAGFFGINPRLAELMDPQHRLFLVAARNLLEKTGYLPETNDKITGVFVGCSGSTYYNNNVIWHKDKVDQQGRFSILSITDKDYISTRTAYHLNLDGPAVNVNSACSTSLLAVAQAVESLRSGKCEVAIAGGAAIHVPVVSGHFYQEGAVYSIDGHCKPFDADAKGTIFSDGVGAVLLKPLINAEADGDIICGVIKGIGINNDGGNKGSFSAPSAEGQCAAIGMAIKDANVDPAQISYVETHGTATPLGDPIEIEGLKLAFGEQAKKQYCSIGSVKSNMGHLVHAAGVAGLIKTALALHHQKLPASLNYQKPNPAIDFGNSPFVVNDKLNDWNVEGKRIAGVSSFGVGGTNVHVVVEEYVGNKQTHQPETKQTNAPTLITWSARNTESSKLFAKELLQFAQSHNEIPLLDIAYTLHVTRPDLPVRNAIVAIDVKDLINHLSHEDKLSSTINTLKEKNSNLVFMFPGQGSQYTNMGRELYQNEPVYKQAVDDCAAILMREMNEDIRQVIFSADNDDAATEKLKNTYYTQPCIFTTSYALARLYMSWGLQPNALVGHSIGEFVAAHLAGVFSLADVLKVVVARAKLISNLPGGSMLSVRTSVNEIMPLLPLNVSVAAINAPNLCVLSGEYDAIEKFSLTLNEKGIANKLLRTSHAFHSAMIDPVVEPLKKVIETVSLNLPRIPILSTVTTGWMKDEEAKSAEYWAHHSRATVNFSGAIVAIENDLHPVFLETGPGTTANILVKQQGTDAGRRSVSSLDTANKPEGEQISVKKALGRIWQLGVDVNWKLYYKEEKRRILHDVPTYAYDKKRLWVDPPATVAAHTSHTHNNTQSIAPLPLSIENGISTQTETTIMNRKDFLIGKIREMFESASGIDVSDASTHANFTEIGLDSLLLTQIASTLKKEFKVPVTFRQLNEECDTLDKLSAYLDASLPMGVYQPAQNNQPKVATPTNTVVQPVGGSNDVLNLISQQIHLLAQQVALLQGNSNTTLNHQQLVNGFQQTIPPQTTINNNNGSEDLTAEEKVELKKPFGATAKIDTKGTAITPQQTAYLQTFIKDYTQKTAKSKSYTQEHRSYMADPRVVSGFKPHTKEIVYSIVVNKSKGCYLWDIDGNKYIDALNGFGSNFLGYQPDVLKNALIEQIEKGYEIGPQHELAGEVSKMICEFTGFDRAALCNTGSEAVLGAMRIARTVSAKNLIVAFTGAYHGINDEVLVRGTKKLKTFPAASGILADNVQNMLILEYGADESLQVIKERAADIAAVLIEPVQSRRPEFQPIEFLKKLRTLTQENDVALIFDEVITGFRCHPGGAQALFGIKADIGTYGKIVGGGLSIGVIAGKKKYMDALDGGFWQYGDDSKPEVGITYFAGTFVRHPLVLATAKATLNYLKEQGPALQEGLTNTTALLANKLNTICNKYGLPIYIANFSTLWRVKFKEEYPYYELLFAVMRHKGIHIWDGFSCFVTTGHTKEDIDEIVRVFEESVVELTNVGFIPKTNPAVVDNELLQILNSAAPPVPGARLGKDTNGNAAWFIADDANPGKFLKIEK